MSARLRAAAVSAPPLNPTQLARLHDLVVEERSLQVRRQKELTAAPSFDPDVTAALLNACEEALSDLEGALALLSGGDYGSCLTCEIAIPFERLEAVPGALFCVPCQVRRERLAC